MDLNDIVSVKLTEAGAKHLNRVFEGYNALHCRYKNRTNYVAGEVYKESLWMLFVLFSETINPSSDKPFNDLQLIEEIK